MLICVFIVECSPKTHDTAFVEGTDLEGADVTIGIAAKDGTMRSRHGDNISFLFDNDILQPRPLLYVHTFRKAAAGHSWRIGR